MEPVSNVLDQFESVLECFDQLGNSSTHVATRARGLQRQLLSGNTVLGLLMASEWLKPLECLNRSLQARSETVAGMIKSVNTVVEDLHQLRTDEGFDQILRAENELIRKFNLGVPEIA